MRITVQVAPRSSKNSLAWEQGVLKARLAAPPVAGAANEALIALLAERLGLPKRDIRIVHGVTGRRKTLEIAGMTLEVLEQRMCGGGG